ncbi:hypothetical protein [Boudabousia tangfeifanii]|uniref:hypothetical protein n=1 Tax=Boudabousia tangfeifanii TaxID=1912795 RepID=UPI0014787A7D|nr:hypothetical protein [Boudabousia tangfeifanii]
MSENEEITYEKPVFADLSSAPLPTKSTLFKRRCVILQFLSFMSFNLNIMKMVVTGHKS